MGAGDGGSRESLEGLRHEIDELRTSRARLVLAADAERRGIERQLHDGLQQRLVALAVILQLVEAAAETDPTQATALLDEMTRDVQLALEEASLLAERLYPTGLAAGGLASAVRSKASGAGIPVEVRVEARTEYPQEILATLYWCFVKVLEGARAGATAAMSVYDDEEGVNFEIVVDRPHADGSLDTLPDRIAALGGRLAVEWDAARALRISGSLPLARRD